MTTTAKPRRARARPPRASARVDRFFTQHLHHRGAYAGEPFIPDDWQREAHRGIFDTVDRHGRRRYREGLIGVPKGNGKTPDGAGIALYGLYADGEPEPECYVVAGSRPQARILFDDAKAMVLGDPYLRACSKIYRDAIEVPETGGVFRVLSSDASLAHGYRPHIAVVDEVWVHKKPDLYEALASALHKRSQSLLLGLTTAGWDRSSLAWRLYERGIAGDDPEFFFRWYAARDGCKITDTTEWRNANPASFVTIAQLRSQLRRLPEPVFRRLHLNQWTSSEATWIDLDTFDAVAAPDWLTVGIDDHGVLIPPDSPVWIGVDAAPKRDTTAVVVDWLDENMRHHWRYWVFARDRAMGHLDYRIVEDLLRELCHVYDVHRILFDPFHMMRSMIELIGEGLPCEEFPQNDARMVPVAQTLYDVVLEQRLAHGGTPDLRAQAAAAKARETTRGWRLDKLGARPIDTMIAGGMATLVAEQDAEREGPVIWTLDDDDIDDDQLS